MSAVKPDYHCTMDELYEVARAGWQSCTDDLPQFTPVKGFYLLPFITAKKTAIDNAEVLPTDQARGADHEVKRSAMFTQADICLGNWLQLERYIDTAYPDPVTKKARLEEAGLLNYPAAAAHNWEKVKDVLLKGTNFLAAHTPDLTAGNNMPVGFAATYNGARTTFLPMLTAFLNSEQTAHSGTQSKVAANNAIYADLISMFADGSFIFRHDPAKKGDYNFTHVKNMISSPGTAGLNMTVVEDVTFVPIENATCSMQQAGQPAVMLQTDAQGVCSFASLAVGKYILTVTDAQHVTVTVEVTIKTGVHSRRKVVTGHV